METSIRVVVEVSEDRRDFHQTSIEVRGATDREVAWARRQIGLDPIPYLGETRH